MDRLEYAWHNKMDVQTFGINKWTDSRNSRYIFMFKTQQNAGANDPAQ